MPNKGKTRITIYIDDNILAEFRTRAEEAGIGSQTMMNEALRAYLGQEDTAVPLTEPRLRRILQEELRPLLAQELE